MFQASANNESYENARAVLMNSDGTPTSKFQAYLEYEEAWKRAKKTYEEAYARAATNPIKLHMWAVEGKTYIDDINTALTRWIATGYKNEIENAISILESKKSQY